MKGDFQWDGLPISPGFLANSTTMAQQKIIEKSTKIKQKLGKIDLLKSTSSQPIHPIFGRLYQKYQNPEFPPIWENIVVSRNNREMHSPKLAFELRMYGASGTFVWSSTVQTCSKSIFKFPPYLTQKNAILCEVLITLIRVENR